MRTKGTSWISRFLRHHRLGPHLKSVRRSKDGMLTTTKFEASYRLPCLTTCRSSMIRSKRKKSKAKAKTIIIAKDAKSAPVAPVGKWARERE
ncbi:UNVERIFIED_CONTAM: hypothetical protein Sradi_6469200 [Sesamum radiatum]|uniref:Uncharacterized protein n=1 Tax=Sesamum radiatum TaxID=300843 RepID=A0AAW2K5L8_SESRA